MPISFLFFLLISLRCREKGGITPELPKHNRCMKQVLPAIQNDKMKFLKIYTIIFKDKSVDSPQYPLLAFEVLVQALQVSENA